MIKYTVESINSSARHDPDGFVRQSTKNYLNAVEKAAKFILESKKKIVMLAGPSSSGKTTTAGFLSDFLEKSGKKAKIISLDDFYLESLELYPLNSDGSYDFESIHSLDLELISSCFEEIIENGETVLPVFDFTTHSRAKETKHIVLDSDTVLIVEGIHGLNPLITGGHDDEYVARLYVSVSSRVYDDDNVILSKRNMRFIRRLVRDSLFRATPAFDTFAIWSSVMAGEGKYIFPFRSYADIKLDSFHPCEPGLLAGDAYKLLDSVRGTQYEETANEFYGILNCFEVVDRSALTPDSLLCEFLGKP